MDRLSPHYRTDDYAGLDPAVRDALDTDYFEQLPYINESNPKMLVVFAGGNAIGKSVLSQQLSHELRGIRLENDGIKRAILKRRPGLAMTDEIHQLTWKYTMDLYQRLDSLTQNGLIIRDGVIQWYYDRILPIFEDRGYKIFVVGYDLSENKMRQLIHARGDTPTSTEQRFYDLIEDQKIHLKRFFEHHQADIMLHDDTVFDHAAVLAAARDALSKITL